MKENISKNGKVTNIDAIALMKKKISIKREKARILILQLCVDEELTDRGGGKNSGKKGVASIDYIDQLLINFRQRNSQDIYHFPHTAVIL